MVKVSLGDAVAGMEIVELGTVFGDGEWRNKVIHDGRRWRWLCGSWEVDDGHGGRERETHLYIILFLFF